MPLNVASVWTGATTHTTAQVKCLLAGGGSATLQVADNEAMTGAVSFGPVASGAGNIVVWNVTGLSPDTRYWTVIDDGALNTSFKSTFLTHPVAAGERASYIFGAAGDAGLTGDGDEGTVTSGVSNGFAFDTMRLQSADDGERWLWFSHLGDLHYKNISTNDVTAFRNAYTETMNYGAAINPAARQSQFFRSLSSTYVWDDHDFGANNSNRTSASNPAANSVYREWVPHYPLPGGSTGIYQSWQVGRVLYIASDVRSFRDPNSDPLTPAKTMLGSGQKAWMEALLSTARDNGAEVLVWQTPSRWVGGDDTWNDFSYERAEMVELFGDAGWLDRMVLMTADMHAVSICSGPANGYGRFPMFMFAGLDAGAWSTGTEYDIGSVAGRRQYGTMRVQDNGHTIALTGTGYHDGTVLMQHTAYLHIGNPVIALSHAGGHISEPFTPTDDDQKIRNLITARRTDGGEYTYAKTTGPYNTGDPADSADAVGEYDEGVEVNVADDAQLPDQASWRGALSTVDEDRYPVVRIDLARNPDLVDQVAGLYVGDRLTISDPPPEGAPDTIEIIAEGGTERIGHPNHLDVDLNASPGTPWLVAHLVEPATLVHAGFETDLESFTGEGGAAVARIASPGVPPFGGAWSCRITPDGVTATGGAVGPLTATSTVVPGTQYRISMWAYAAGGMADVRPAVHWHDEAGAFLSSSGPAQPALAAGVWTLMTAVVTAPANATRLKARAIHGGTPAASAIWYVDGIAVQEVTATGKSAGPDRPNRFDTGSSRLVAAVNSSATSFVVHTPANGIRDRSPWIQSTGITGLLPAQFPFDLKLGGEVVRCTACTPSALDQFGRSASSGWGSATVGGAWSTSGGSASDYDVNGSVGRHSHGTRNVFRYTSLNGLSLADVEVRASITIPVVPTGDGLSAFILARANIGTGAYYFARLTAATTSTVQLTLRKRLPAETLLATAPHTLPFTAGATYRVRLQIEGTTVRAKAWPLGGVEPEDWEVSATDTSLTSGAVGCGSFIPTTNTNTLPVVFSFDDVEVFPQVMTVQRSINTVVKSHDAGAPISLARPAPAAL
jgi:hypothetical protein